MKKILLALVAVVLMASFASASVLVPANTLGAGKWGYLGAAGYSMSSVANSNIYSVGGFGAYGVMDNLDVYLKAGYGLPADPPTGVTANAVQLGLAAKYLLVSESKDMPVSVAALAGYQTTTFNVTAPITMQTATGDLGGGVVVSKVMVPWVPYGAAVYHSLNDGTTTGSSVEIAIGTQMLLSKSAAIVGEFSYNSITMGGSSTESKISLAYSAKI